MARVYKWAQGAGAGMKTTEVAARHATTRRHLDHHTLQMALVAERKLAQHKHDGHAAIEVDQGRIDNYVTLTDERGQGAAMTIEFGRKGDTVYRSGPLKGQPVPPMEPVAPLRTAMGRKAAKVGRRE